MSRPPFEIARLDDIPAETAPGAPDWKPVRRRLGIEAFGVNAYTAPNEGDVLVEEHTEMDTGSAGHQELYVVIGGRARFTLDGEVVDAPAGTLVFVRDPAVRRRAEAATKETAVLVIGAPVGEPFVPAAWEFSRAAHPPPGGEDVEATRDVVAGGLEFHPDVPTLLYNLACYESLAGRSDEAIQHLRRAIELDPRAAEWARDDADFDAVRTLPRFPA